MSNRLQPDKRLTDDEAKLFLESLYAVRSATIMGIIDAEHIRYIVDAEESKDGEDRICRVCGGINVADRSMYNRLLERMPVLVSELQSCAERRQAEYRESILAAGRAVSAIIAEIEKNGFSENGFSPADVRTRIVEMLVALVYSLSDASGLPSRRVVTRLGLGGVITGKANPMRYGPQMIDGKLSVVRAALTANFSGLVSWIEASNSRIMCARSRANAPEFNGEEYFGYRPRKYVLDRLVYDAGERRMRMLNVPEAKRGKGATEKMLPSEGPKCRALRQRIESAIKISGISFVDASVYLGFETVDALSNFMRAVGRIRVRRSIANSVEENLPHLETEARRVAAITNANKPHAAPAVGLMNSTELPQAPPPAQVEMPDPKPRPVDENRRFIRAASKVTGKLVCEPCGMSVDLSSVGAVDKLAGREWKCPLCGNDMKLEGATVEKYVVKVETATLQDLSALAKKRATVKEKGKVE